MLRRDDLRAQPHALGNPEFLRVRLHVLVNHSSRHVLLKPHPKPLGRHGKVEVIECAKEVVAFETRVQALSIPHAADGNE